MMIPVEGHSNLFRDENSGAIINCDTHAYDQYINLKNKRKNQELEIQQIKNDICEIKSLLQELINGTKWNCVGIDD